MSKPLDNLKSQGKIFYIIPDIHKKSLDLRGFIKAIFKGAVNDHIQKRWLVKHKPIGGIKVMLQHCILLQELGCKATPLRLGRYEGNFFGYSLRSQHISEVSLDLGPYDVVVCPEICPSGALRFRGGKKVMFVQNWVHLYDANTFEGEAIHGLYTGNGFDKVMCCSEFLTTKVQDEPSKGVAVVNNFIDLKAFTQDGSARVPMRVLALPRKNFEDLKTIMALVEGEGFDFHLADGLSQRDLIIEYQKADIFLATGYPEGFGLPPLEAMACGAVVVGFSGGGGDAFMRHNDTALVAEDGDCEGAAELLKSLRSNPDQKDRLRERAHKTAQLFSRERSRDELLEFYESLFE